jgi:tryptophan synthase beta chain
MVSWFQSVIGHEAREQILSTAGKLPDRIYACVGGGSNAIGLFQGFMDDAEVQLIGCEAGGFGPGKGNHAARLAYKDASVGVAQGMKTYFLQNDDGNMIETHSVAAGLDYIGVNPILVHLWEQQRVRFEAVTDSQVTEALQICMQSEGIIPALESAHGFAQAIKEAEQMSTDEVILINMSGRGDKDIFTIADALDDSHWKQFIAQKATQYRNESKD